MRRSERGFRGFTAILLLGGALATFPLLPAPSEARGVDVTHTITEQEDRGDVTVAPGDTLEVRLVANPIRVGDVTDTYSPAPLLGQHSADVLGERVSP